MQRLIVTSATYRQSSQVTPELLEKDPENRLLARGPRFRLPAEMVRDNALAVSGLLDTAIGGPSVFPYQPKGLWEEMAFGDGLHRAELSRRATARDLYRRSMYTFWKRTVPPAALITFDAPDREKCTVAPPRHQHAAAGAGAAERPDLRRSRPRARAARHLEGRRDPPARVRFALPRWPPPAARRPPNSPCCLDLEQRELRSLPQGSGASSRS